MVAGQKGTGTWEERGRVPRFLLSSGLCCIRPSSTATAHPPWRGVSRQRDYSSGKGEGREIVGS